MKAGDVIPRPHSSRQPFFHFRVEAFAFRRCTASRAGRTWFALPILGRVDGPDARLRFGSIRVDANAFLGEERWWSDKIADDGPQFAVACG